MSVEYSLYAGGYVACGLAALAVACLVVLDYQRMAPLGKIMPELLPFGLLLILLTAWRPDTTPLRVYGYVGLLATFALAWRWPQIARRGLSIVGYIVAAVIIFEALLIRQRPTYLANPNMTAAWLLACWPWLSPAVAVLAILCTQSRAALAGLVLAGLAWVLSRSRMSRKWQLVILSSVAMLTPWLAYLRIDTVADRFRTWATGLQLVTQWPWYGWGPGASLLFGRDHFDSAPLTIAVEMGVVGLVALALLVWGIGRRGYKSASPARWALLALAVQNIADDTWLWPITALLIGANLALLVAEAETAPSPASAPVEPSANVWSIWARQ